MKLLSTYLKEMKIASRGFYFYIEIFVAVIMLLILLVAIDEYPNGTLEEYLYYDMPDEVFEYVYKDKIESGEMVVADDVEFELEPISFDVLNKTTNEVESYKFEDTKVITAKTYELMVEDPRRIERMLYIIDNEEDVLRLAIETGDIGATTMMDENGEFSYRYMLQGYEREQLYNFLYIYHTLTDDVIDVELDNQVIRELGSYDTLNNRELVVPVFLTFAGSMMGFFIIMSYIYLDRNEGVIKAFAVTPSSVWKYLLTKTFVIMTTVVISSSIITIPVMGYKPNYLLLYIYVIVTTFAFSTLGLFISSFYDSISKAFGVLYTIMLFLLAPVFSYYISSFDPMWIRFLPTYPVLQGFESIVLGNGDVLYIMTNSIAFIIAGIVFLMLSNYRYKKTLTV